MNDWKARQFGWIGFKVDCTSIVLHCWIGPSINFGCACERSPTESAKGRRVCRVTRLPIVVVSSCEGCKITPYGAHIVFTVAHARGVVSVDLTLPYLPASPFFSWTWCLFSKGYQNSCLVKKCFVAAWCYACTGFNSYGNKWQ